MKTTHRIRNLLATLPVIAFLVYPSGIRADNTSMVIIDPVKKQEIQGCVTLARVWAEQIPISEYPRVTINLKEAMNRFTGVAANLAGNTKLDSERLHDLPVIFLTANDRFTLTPAERENLARYLEQGGFLICDNGLGNYADSPVERSFRTLMHDIFGDNAVYRPMTSEHDVYHSFFDLDEGAPKVYAGNLVNSGTLTGVWKDGTLKAIYSNMGYSVEWNEGDRRILPLKMAVNMIIFALTREDGTTRRAYR